MGTEGKEGEIAGQPGPGDAGLPQGLPPSAPTPVEPPRAEAMTTPPGAPRKVITGFDIRRAKGEKKYSSGDVYKQTSKPPSRASLIAKLILLILVPLSLVAVVGGGFIVKTRRGDILWTALLKKLGIIGAPASPETGPEKVPVHPMLDDFQATCGRLDVLKKFQLLRLRRKLEDREADKPWTKEEVAQLHMEMDKAAAEISVCQEKFAKHVDWIRGYNEQLGVAEQAFEELKKDPQKQAALEAILRGHVPSDLEPFTKDTAIQRYLGVQKTLECDKFTDVNLREDQVDEWLRDANSMMRELRTLRGKAPSRTMFDSPAPKSAGPAPKAEEPAPKAEAPAPKAEEPAPKAEAPAPKAEEPAPKAEEPAPKVEEPAPKAEEPAPKVEAPAPKVKKPVPAPPGPKGEEILAKADEMLVEALQLFGEVSSAAKELPEEREALQGLLKKGEDAVILLTAARQKYAAARERIADPSKADERIGRIEKMLARLQKHVDGIKSRLE